MLGSPYNAPPQNNTFSVDHGGTGAGDTRSPMNVTSAGSGDAWWSRIAAQVGTSKYQQGRNGPPFPIT